MDWTLAITRNRDALRRIVAALFVMAGAATEASTSPRLRAEVTRATFRRGAVTLPRHVYVAIMLILRPAESALRRLIIIAAQGLRFNSPASHPLPAGLPTFTYAGAQKIPAFCLFDSLKNFDLDDFDNNAQSHSGFFNTHDEVFLPPHPVLAPDEPVDAASLFLRLRSLRHALNDLPRQARRLARCQARRDFALKSKAPFRPMRITPFRPGLPPGWRQRPIHAIDDVLRECHGLAPHAVNGPDTG